MKMTSKVKQRCTKTVILVSMLLCCLFLLQFIPILKELFEDESFDNAPAQVIETRLLYPPGFIDFPSEICLNDGDEMKLLIIITSAPAHRENRLAIRQTWGHFGTRRDIGIAFLIGTAGAQMDDALAAEKDLYNDIIRGRFIDSYNNLTLKTISMLEWIDAYCPKASFILKTDDDMFINVPKLLQIIDKKSTDKRTIYGRLVDDWKPVRNKKSKYFISFEEFSETVLPHFVTGPAYLMTSDCVKDLYEEALYRTYFKLEDVFLTGIVAKSMGIKRVKLREFANVRVGLRTINVTWYVSIHNILPSEQFKLWMMLMTKSGGS